MSDTLFYNGTILSMNSDTPNAEVVVVRDHKILAIGTEAETRDLVSKNANTVDLAGRCLLPGFHDSHVHLTLHGFELSQLHLENAQTLDEALELISQRASELPQGTWLLGFGFLMSRWNMSDLHKRDLDRVAPHHPVFLRSQDHHSAWVNSLALRLATITASTPQPEHGEIVRDKFGEATGMLLERATHLIQNAMPAPTQNAIQNAIRAAGQHFASLGITTVHEMAAQPLSYLKEQGKLASQPEFPVRVWACIDQEYINQDYLEQADFKLPSNEHFQLRGAKFFADGALGSLTALMLEPYAGTTETGFPVHGLDFMKERFPLAIKAGLTPVIHAIGDRANRDVLDALESTRHLWQPLNMRPRIEHAQHLQPSDVSRFTKLGVIPSVQPIHYRFDAKRIAELLPDRVERAHAWRVLTDSGAHIPLGSDTPVATPDVILGLQTACSRHSEDGSVIGSQTLTIDEALAGYTKHAAHAVSWEHRSGQIRAGYNADVVILSHDPHESLKNLTVQATMKAGRWTFEK
jgi:predicted amidohydrolase YtcJ